MGESGGGEGVYGTEWDDGNIGDYSIAGGYGSKASGLCSVGLGYLASATGWGGATSLGFLSTASGPYAAFASGYFTTASGTSAQAGGHFSTASGHYSTALGHANQATGTGSMSFGGFTIAAGDYSTSLGYTTTARSYASTVVGRYNVDNVAFSPTTWVPTEPLFVVGNGTSTAAKNAFVVYKSGDAGVQGALRVWGGGDISMGDFHSGTEPPAK